MKTVKIITIFLMLLTHLNSFEIDLSHKLTSTFRSPLEFNSFFAELNYKPDLMIDIYEAKKYSFDTNLSYSFDLDYKYGDHVYLAGKLYRGWLRYSSTTTEFRAGLQKINFGPAQILRSLQWFDSIDPLDPTRSTEGVKAILNRTYFKNNANLWLWGIWGRSTSLENFFHAETPEIGGRLQYPFKFCDAAVSYNWKETETSNGQENRIAVDARWDMLIGFWTEYYISQFSKNINDFASSLTLGADYTVSIGNGVYIATEFLRYSIMPDVLFKESADFNSAAISINYPFGLFDQLSSIILVDIDNQEIYSSFTYQYSLDYLTVYLNISIGEENLNINESNKLELILQWNY